MFFINEFIGEPFPHVSINNKTQKNLNKQNYIYLLKDNKILKLLITIDENIIKENFIKLKQYLNFKNYKAVSQRMLWKENFPLDDNQFKHYEGFYFIPDKNKENCKLLYLLNSMYNEENISDDDLFKINEENEYYSKSNNGDKRAVASIEVIKNIVNSLEIEKIDEYDYKLFLDSINFLETITSKEKLNILLELNDLKNILLTAESNKDVFETLGIDVNLEKEKDFIK